MIDRSPWSEIGEDGQADLPLPEHHAAYRDLCAAVARLGAAGVRLPSPHILEDWRGRPHVGVFIRLDRRTCGLHLGRGHYVVLDLERDLNGIAPPEGERRILCRSGAVRRPDTHGAYNFF